MRVLLDTHALIWYVDQDHLLSASAHAAITNPANDLLVSAATIWEIAIKVGLGKLTLSMPYRQWMDKAIADLGLTLLPITVEYADVQVGLPGHHRDPFDRLLAAQAQVEGLSVLSGDAVFDRYGVPRIWQPVA
jgi:PIN domain nuclease of toxin-antitoxin system